MACIFFLPPLAAATASVKLKNLITSAIVVQIFNLGAALRSSIVTVSFLFVLSIDELQCHTLTRRPDPSDCCMSSTKDKKPTLAGQRIRSRKRGADC